MDPAIRSGQLRLTCPGLTRSRCRFRIDREALVTASSRTGASRRLEVTDHPRLIGWSSLHPAHRQSLTPLCRRSGTASPVPGPTGSWLDARLATNASRLPARPRPSPCRTLRSCRSADQDAFHRVSIDRSFPRPPCRTRHLVWKLRATRAPFSLRGRRRVRQHAVRRAPGPAPRRRFALRFLERRDARCVGPVSAISRLRTSTHASPAPEWSNACAPAIGDPVCFTAERVALVGPTWPLFGISPRRALSSRRDA
jgi:hypothetical protein